MHNLNLDYNRTYEHETEKRTFAAGNPYRVIREITEADSMVNHPERLGGSRPK